MMETAAGTALPRSPAEILARIEQIEHKDTSGAQTRDLIKALPFNDAALFLKEGTTAAEWGVAPDTAAVRQDITDYMPFAWYKANSCRGTSSARSIDRFTAWLWLLGDPLADQLSPIYRLYGKPCLVLICDAYGINWRALDDGRWRDDITEDGVPAPA